jgi:hypothetical protein
MDIDTDSEQSTQNQMESEDKTPNTTQRGNMGPHESSELQQPPSVSDHSTCLVRPENYRILWEHATGHFRCMFTENEYRHKCYVCDRLWFLRDLKVAIAAYLVEYFPGENTAQLKLCNNCYKVCKTNGDFNISEDDRAKSKEYLCKHFHLELKNDLAEQTTLSGSCIELTFSTHMYLI